VRIAFLGNHTVGVRALETIAATDDVVAVVAHPADPEDGVRYESVHDLAVRRGWPVLRATGRSPELPAFLAQARPDLVWITDYRYLVPADVLAAAPLGAVNLHPSLLPLYRGRAPINWAIINGETTLGLTAHVVDEGMDTGDVIAQVAFELGPDEDVGDALEALYPLYARVTAEVLAHFRAGAVPRTPQDHAVATVFGARKPADGAIDWTRPAEEVVNLVRAVARPYPGAFTDADGGHLVVWRARTAAPAAVAAPGTVVGAGAHGPIVCCGAGAVELLDVEGPSPRLAEVLGRAA
jgi:methionyl-tRNA formyltransferase